MVDISVIIDMVDKVEIADKVDMVDKMFVSPPPPPLRTFVPLQYVPVPQDFCVRAPYEKQAEFYITVSFVLAKR